MFNQLLKIMKNISNILFRKSSDKNSNKIILITSNGTEIKKKANIKGLKICFYGKNNVLKIYQPCIFEDSEITFAGNDCDCTLRKCRLVNARIIENEGAKFFVDESSTVNGLFMLVNEKNTSVSIGKDCMFSSNISFWPTDGHAIFDENKNCINKSKKGIFIGNHVWVGYGCTILKNVSIADNCVIGASSVVTNSFLTPGTLIAGNTAKALKNNIFWNREPPF